MDLFTNFLISSAAPVVIWALGAFYIRQTGPDPMRYIQWLKYNAIAFVFVSTIVSLALFALFPDPGEGSLLKDVTGITVPGNSNGGTVPVPAMTDLSNLENLSG